MMTSFAIAAALVVFVLWALGALSTTYTTSAANAATNAVTALLNSGFVEIYSGAQPATANTAIGAQALLVTLSFGATAFAGASGGVATANVISSGVAGASGTATWARLYKTDGTTPVLDCSVGTSGCNINLASASIAMGNTVAISSMILTTPLVGA